MILLLIFSVLLALVATFFALQNADPVAVQFLTYHFEGSLAVVLLATLLAGVVIAALFILPFAIRKTWNLGSANRKVKFLTEEIDSLKKELLSKEEELNSEETKDFPTPSA